MSGVIGWCRMLKGECECLEGWRPKSIPGPFWVHSAGVLPKTLLSRWGRRRAVNSMVSQNIFHDSQNIFGDQSIESVIGRSREIRETMSRHIAQNTVCADADRLLKEGCAVFNELELILKHREVEKEELEQRYLNSSVTDSAVIDKITDLTSQVAKMTGEVALWKATVPPPPMPIEPKRCAGTGCCSAKAPFRRHRKV